MDRSKSLLIKVVIDFCITAAVGLPILLLYLLVNPYERGFFCNDESLIHPYKENTVTMTMLVVVGITVPYITIIVTEIIRGNLKLDGSRRVKLLSWSVPVIIQKLYIYLGFFTFGAASCQLATDIAKYTVGRLRPHFISVCRPRRIDGTDCSNEDNLHVYIEEFSCTNEDASDKMLKDMRLSFPSGHASFAFFTMVFCAIYLQYRMNWRGSKLLKHGLQFLLFTAAFYTCLSRISDYKHHWSDVLAGSLLGITTAIIVSSMSNIYKRYSDPNSKPAV